MGENLKLIDGRINALWSQGGYTEACVIMLKELVPAIQDDLVSRGMGREDAEDAASEAWAGFLKKMSKDGPLSIALPKPYLWKAALRRCIDHHRDKPKAAIPESEIAIESEDGCFLPNATLDHHFQAGAERGLVPTWQVRAIYVIEGLFEDIEIEESDASRTA